MPRSSKGRGGARTGTPGTAYPNRTDLAGSVATGQPYGHAAAQLDAQSIVPMGTPSVPAASTPASWPLPGAAGPLDRPTERPGEPVTAGVGVGPGPGPTPEGPDPDIEALRQYLPVFELLASDPSSAPSTRAYVRRLRAFTPRH